jgi:hypothetical protein
MIIAIATSAVAVIVIGLLYSQSQDLSDTEDALTTLVAEQEEFASTVESERAANEAAFSRLAATATQVTTNLDEAQATAAALENDLATAEAQADANETAFSRLAATAAALENDLATARAEVAANEQALTRAENTQSTLEASVQNYADEIATLQAPSAISENPLADIEVGAALVYETFDEIQAPGSFEWYVGDVPPHGSARREDGQYIFEITSTPGIVETSNFPYVDDFYLEVEVDFEGCPPSGYVGIGLRIQEDFSGYSALISCDLGPLTLWELSYWTPLEDWIIVDYNVFSPASTDRSRPHTLGVMANGDEITLFFDGVLLGSVTDKSFSEGVLSLYGESGEEPVTLRFDNLRVWEMPE